MYLKTIKAMVYIGQFRKKLPETVSYSVESKGSGKLVYMIDNPLFRAFWENGILLFSNALFLVNNSIFDSPKKAVSEIETAFFYFFSEEHLLVRSQLTSRPSKSSVM